MTIKSSQVNQLRECSDLVTREVPCPEWGDSVIIRSMTGAERDAFEKTTIRMGKKGEFDVVMENARVRLVVLTAVDEDGHRLFTEADIEWLSQKNARVLDRLADVARDLAGLTPKDMEDLAKNSASGPSAASGSV